MEEQKKEEKAEKNEILFFHGSTNERNWNDHRFTVAAVCYPTQITLAIAICSKDDQFVKAEGRKRAIERLQAGVNTNGCISILLTLKKGTERRIFNRFANLFQSMSKAELIELFSLRKD